MGFTTFSGPLRSGTVKEGASINAGTPVLARVKTLLPTVALTANPVAQLIGYVPAGSKLLAVQVEKPVALSGNSVSAVAMTVGDGTTADKYVGSVAIGITAIRTPQATIDAGYKPVDMDNVGTSDVGIYATFTATTGNPDTGSIEVTLLYLQRSAAGLQDPATP